jgi:hypothetical protein
MFQGKSALSDLGMNVFPLVAMFTSASLALLPVALNSITGYRANGGSVFSYSLGFRIFIWVGSIGFTLMGFIFKAFGIDGTAMQWAITLCIGGFAIFACIYTDKYQVRLDAHSLTFGSFKKTELAYEDIKSAKVVAGRPRILEIISTDGKIYQISGNLLGFGELSAMLSNKLSKVGPLHEAVGST